MVSYTTGATALLSLATAVTTTTAINAVERPKNNNNIIHRKLGETEIKTDVTCEQKWEGTPQVCVDVCLEVTSTFKNGKLDSEESMVYHDKCPEIVATRYGGSGGHSGGGHSGGGHSGTGSGGSNSKNSGGSSTSRTSRRSGSPASIDKADVKIIHQQFVNEGREQPPGGQQETPTPMPGQDYNFWDGKRAE